MSFERIAENRIREAIRNGEFDRLQNAGRPVDLEEYFATPEDVRMAYAILKNAHVVPDEVELLGEIARLQQVVQASCDPAARDAANAALQDRQLRLSVLREQRVRSPRRAGR